MLLMCHRLMRVTDVGKSPRLPIPAHPLSAKGGNREGYNSGVIKKDIWNNNETTYCSLAATSLVACLTMTYLQSDYEMCGGAITLPAYSH